MKNLFLMCHGEPRAGDRKDATLSLTDDAAQQVHDMAHWLRRENGTVNAVICASAAYCVQTASIMAQVLGCPAVADTKVLDVKWSQKKAWDEIGRLAQQSDDVLVVAAPAILDQIALWLLTGDDGGDGIGFEYSAIAKIQNDKRYSLRWIVDPSLVADSSQREVVEAAREFVENAALMPAEPRIGFRRPEPVMEMVISKLDQILQHLGLGDGAELKEALADYMPAPPRADLFEKPPVMEPGDEVLVNMRIVSELEDGGCLVVLTKA